MDDTTPASKAAGFTTTARVIREDADDQRFAALLAALPPETRALVETPPVAVSWLEIHHFARLIDTALSVVYDRDVGAIARVSRRSIFRDLSSLYRMFIRLSSPMFVIERAAAIWGKYNRNHGRMVAAPDGPNAALVTVSEVAIGSPAYWAYQRGAILATLDATGYPSGTVEQVGGGGRNQASFRARW